MKTLFGVVVAAILLAACGSPDEGPALGAFEPITKKETDEPFNLSAPSSKSPAPFTFTSSNANVATIEGARVTIKGVGETTITASQPSSGSFGPTRKSTTLTVSPVPCDSGQVRIGGTCQAVPTCISPATLNAATNKCVAPASSAATVASGNRSFMGATFADSYGRALDFCSNTVIDNQSGWTLPTVAELSALYASGAITGRGWMQENTWTKDPDTNSASAAHQVVHLGSGATGSRVDTLPSYVTCVR